MKLAVLDDYQNVALAMADWSPLDRRAEITVFHDTIGDTEALIQRLAPFDILCVMRERTPMTAERLARLPNLKLIVSTGARNAAIDMAAAKARNIEVRFTGYGSQATIELVWALILGVARHIATENASIRAGGWQTTVGSDLDGKILGLLGVGRIGTRVAEIGKAFGMRPIAWSPNLTPERAEAAGVKLVSKAELFEQADFLTIHMVLGATTRGLVQAGDLARMQPTSFLINTSRGPLVDEKALIATLRAGKIAGAALDVFDTEPLPKEHPFRSMPNVLATPHIGYVGLDAYRVFYADTVKQVATWLDGRAPLTSP